MATILMLIINISKGNNVIVVTVIFSTGLINGLFLSLTSCNTVVLISIELQSVR